MTLNENIKKQDKVVLLFYTDWCGHCKAFSGIYNEVSVDDQIKLSNIVFGKVNGQEDTQLLKEYGVSGYPTLFYIHKNSICHYKDDVDRESIVNWILSASRDHPLIDDYEVFVEQSKKEQFYMVVHKNESIDEQLFNKLIQEIQCFKEIYLIMVNDQVCNQINCKSNGFSLFKENKLLASLEMSSTLNFNEIKKLWAFYTRPLFIEFSRHNIKFIMNDAFDSYGLFFLNENDELKDEYLHMGLNLSQRFIGKMRMCYLYMNRESSIPLLESFGLLELSTTTFIIASVSTSPFKRFLFTGDFLYDRIGSFVDDYFLGNLKPTLKSQKLPTDWDSKSVKVIVSHTFNEFINDRSTNVVMYFYAPWCGYCKRFSPIFNQIADSYVGNPKIKFGSIDATANEVEGYDVQGFPQIRIIKSDGSPMLNYTYPRNEEYLKLVIGFVLEEKTNEEIDLLIKNYMNQQNNTQNIHNEEL